MGLDMEIMYEYGKIRGIYQKWLIVYLVKFHSPRMIEQMANICTPVGLYTHWSIHCGTI